MNTSPLLLLPLWGGPLDGLTVEVTVPAPAEVRLERATDGLREVVAYRLDGPRYIPA